MVMIWNIYCETICFLKSEHAVSVFQSLGLLCDCCACAMTVFIESTFSVYMKCAVLLVGLIAYLCIPRLHIHSKQVAAIWCFGTLLAYNNGQTVGVKIQTVRKF